MAKTVKYSSDNPVLNNPYEEPRWYYDTDINGNIDYSTIINGRRPYGYDVSIVPKGNMQSNLFSQEDFESLNPNAKFINEIRKQVKEWRERGYPKASRITTELLNFWFNNNERRSNLKLFFCQREALETAVWLNEIAEKDPNVGNYLLSELRDRRHTVSNDDSFVLPRTAFKMATGTGKTVVMAMLILYHYLNKKANPQDTHYADHFLLCAPGITIRDRLCVLQLDNNHNGNNFNKTDYYHQRGLIPQQFEKELGGLNSSITIVNYQQFLPRTFSGKHESPTDGKVKYVDGKIVKQENKESYSVLLSRILEKGVKGKRIIVINDEAHHCYLPKDNKEKGMSAEEKSEVKEENQSAMVWYEGLRQMKLLGYKVQQVYDLSATPYYLKGSGYQEYSLFPWVVSDFGLVDAIESGLVKIPFLPAYDNAKDLDEPKLRNIYKYVKDALPKKGIEGQRKNDKENNVDRSKLPVQAPNLPTLLNTALEQFVSDYVDYERGLRKSFEEAGSLMTSPPVMIVVCNNTAVSHEVYRFLAGYEDTPSDDGEPRYRAGRFTVFSNYDTMGNPKQKMPSLLIDSAALDTASKTIDNAFKQVYAKEIEDFKTEFVNQGHGNREDVTDADILREVVNTVGKPGKLGGDIKLVVSVSMLTEGWDANTVTHVCGIRAFGSQLLCEQVVGRALRRQSYDLTPYDLTGKQISLKDLHRYKPENIIFKFPPEYARIIGVPFNTFKSGETVITKPPKPKYIVRAIKDRKDMEIKFPVITGYRSDNIDGKLVADFSDVPKFRLNFNQIPTSTALQSVVNDKTQFLQSDCDDLRDSQVVYYYTRLMIREYYTSPENGRQFQKFSDIKKIVEDWYENQLEIVGGNGRQEQKRLVMLWNYIAVLKNINEGIHKANEDQERISAVLNYYNPEGSTAYVFHPTSKPVFLTKKSHVNYVVGESESWEVMFAEDLEKTETVEAYARCKYMGFRIPYSVGDKNLEYEPDFVIRLKISDERTINLLVDLQNFNGDGKGYGQEKLYTLRNYWLPAANNLKSFGEWDLLTIGPEGNVKKAIIEYIESIK